MRRRDFIKAFRGAGLAHPLITRAEQVPLAVVGVVSTRAAEGSAARFGLSAVCLGLATLTGLLAAFEPALASSKALQVTFPGA